MSLPRRLKRPAFEDSQSMWLASIPLEPAERAALIELLPKRMDPDQKRQFIDLVAKSKQIAKIFNSNTAPSDVVGQLHKVQERARALLQSLAALSGESRAALKAHAECLAIGTNPPVGLSLLSKAVVKSRIPIAGRRPCNDGEDDETTDRSATLLGHWSLLGCLWDQAQDLETAAAYTAAQIKPDKATRPSLENSRRLVTLVAKEFYFVSGRLPPSGKRSWFSPFAGELGRIAGMSIGASLVEAAIKDLRKSGRYPDLASGAALSRA